MRIDILMLLCLPFICALSAYFSKKIKVTQSNKYYFIIPIMSIMNGLAWTTISKYTSMSLSVATIVFDTLMSLSYFFAFILLGEAITLSQGIGVVLAIASMILLSK